MRIIYKISPKKLKELYWKRKMSSYEIAGIYNCDSTTIRRHLTKSGIKIRPALEARKLALKINIPKKDLKNLYLKREMSSPKIAKIYKCGSLTIRRLLRKYKIKVRTLAEAAYISKGIDIPKEDLRKLYREKKMTIYEIAKKFNCSHGVILERMRKYNIPTRSLVEVMHARGSLYKRKNFSNNLEEKAYLIGFRLGDLHVHLRSNTTPTIEISTSSAKLEQIQLMEQLFSHYGHVWKSKPDKNKAISVVCYVNRSFSFLLPKKDLIEPWILKNQKYFASFLAGYIDAEGTFYITNKNGAAFEIQSQDKEIIWQINKRLNKLGVLCRPPDISWPAGKIDRRGKISHRDVWRFRVHRKDSLLKLINLIDPYLRHAKRRRKMNIVKNNIKERNIKYNNRPDYRWDKLYLKEGVKLCQATATGVQ